MKHHVPLVILAVVAAAGLSLLLLPAPAEAAEWGVDLRTGGSGDEKAYIPPGPVVFNLTVEHTGTAMAQVVIVDLLGEPAGWTHQLVATTQGGTYSGTDDVSFELAQGEVASLSVTVQPDAAAENGTHWLTVWARAEEDANADDSVDLGVIIPMDVDFEVLPWDPPAGGLYKVAPPDTVTILFAVYNKGLSGDRFQLNVTSSLAASGWEAAFTSGVTEGGLTPPLGPDPAMEDPHLVEVKLLVPADATAGTRARVTVNATSEADPDLGRPPAWVTVEAVHHFAFRVVTEGVDQKEARKGETVDFQMRIHNDGNGPDQFRIFAAWDEEDAPGWVARPEPADVIIEAGGNDTVRYRVTIPGNATLGTYTFHAEVWSSSTELPPVSRTFKVTVARSYGMAVWAEEEELAAAPGERVHFQVMVRNAGNSIDSYNLSFVDWNASWVHYIVPESLTLFPEEDGKANVTVLVPSDLGDSPLPAYAFDLRVESVNGDAERLLALTVAITPYGRLEWLWDGEPVTSPGVPVAANGTLRPKPIIEVYAGTLATLDLRLRNAGVIEDNVTLWAWSPDPLVNVTVRPGGGTVRVGGTMDVYLEISVPDNLSPGEHRVWVNASSSDGRQAPRAVPVEFDIIPYYDGFDFAGLSWDDPLGDEFAYTYRLEADRVASSRGRRAGHADLDILTLTAVLDPATNVVTLTVELKGAPTDDRGVFYGVYFVTEDHQVVGGLVDPRSHEAGDLVWESHDEANTLASMYVSDGQLGSSVPMPSLGVTLGADRVVFTVHADDLRRAGVEPGSGFLVYAYCHRLGAPDEGGGTRLVYDTAGQGAVTGPWEFTDEPEEASSMALVVIAAVAVVAALAVLFVLFVIPRLTPPVPDEEPDEADDWVEFK